MAHIFTIKPGACVGRSLRCPKCGHPVKEDYCLCPQLRLPLLQAGAHASAVTAPSTFPFQWAGEYLIGGVYDSDVGRGLIRGYALFFTSRRIIGVKMRG